MIITSWLNRHLLKNAFMPTLEIEKTDTMNAYQYSG